MSLYHQGSNIDREKLQRLTGSPLTSGPSLSLQDWLQRWIDDDPIPTDDLDSLPGVMWHLSDAWRRRQQPNVVLVHYDDLLVDLEGQMRALSEALRLHVPRAVWRALVEAAGLPTMRARAGRLAPNTIGVLKDNAAFFRRGSSGAGAEVLDDTALERYRQRVHALAPADLLAWLHR